MTTIKFSKAFGEVEVLNQDENFTTIVVLKTGEQKKLSTKYANLSNEPFAKVKRQKAVKRELTNEEKEIVALSVENQMKQLSREASMSWDEWFSGSKNRQAGSSLR